MAVDRQWWYGTKLAVVILVAGRGGLAGPHGGSVVWQRHEYLSGSTKVDRDWWIVAKLVALTAVCALVSAGVFGLL